MRLWIQLAAAAAVLGAGGARLAAFEEGQLLIWINGDKGYRGLQEVGDRFTKELGIPVKVEAPEGATDKFQQAAQSGKGPDIFFWPHDRLGEWADAGILRPVEVSDEFRSRFFDMGWEGFTHNGRLWGYPVSLEAISLIYNKELIQDPPTQLKDLHALHEKFAQERPGVAVILWDYNTPYFTWPILASGGAYVFGKNADGAYNIEDIGVNTDGAKQALAEVVGLIEKGVMPKGTSYSVMEAKMNAGECAMMISGPWAWANLKKSGIDFGLAPIPGVNGRVGEPFVGVLGGMINRASPNVDLIKEFMENYVMTEEGLRTIDNDVPLGIPAHKGFYEKLAAENPLIKASKASVDAGKPMPNVPQMARYWAAMGAAYSNATNGQASAADALDLAAKRLKPKPKPPAE